MHPTKTPYRMKGWTGAPIFLILAGAAAFFYERLPDRASEAEYAALLSLSHPLKPDEPSSTKQERLQVKKELLFALKEDRQPLTLSAEKSALLFDQGKERLQIVENFEGISCSLGEKRGLKAEKGTFVDNKGRFYSSLPDERVVYTDSGAVPLVIKAKNMEIEFHQNALSNMVAKEDIEVEIIGIGVVTCEGRLFCAMDKNNKEPETMQLEGKTNVVCRDQDSHLLHQLTTSGKTVVDMRSGKIFLSKPSGKEQVHYRDRYGELYADEAHVFYEKREGKMVPSSLVAVGNIHLINDQAGLSEEGVGWKQYGLSDRIECNLMDKEVRLTASENRRVLFYDKSNQMTMSAPALKILRDSSLKKDYIHGIGDVRFKFMDREMEQLKKRFNFDEEEFTK